MSEMNAKGPVAWMAQNGVAANLLMIFLLVAGLFSMSSIVQEVFPEFSMDTIQISVQYPGATPVEIEESIVQRIEERIKAVEGVKEITAVASENVGAVTAEVTIDAEVSRVLDDIKAEVDRIITFPDETERPEVREITNRQSAIRIALYGDVSERALKEVAYQVEEALAALPEITYVETSGIRNYEISIDVPNEILQAYGLALRDIAMAVRQGSMDLPAGNIRTSAKEVRVRTLGQNYNQQDFEDIVVLSQPDGTKIRLGQIARVHDGFEETQLITRYNGQRAAFIEVFRTSDERVLEVVAAAQQYIDENLRTTLPEGIHIETWEDSAQNLRDRMELLGKNARIGLLLVVLALALFLNIRLAFWTAVGIGISFIAAFSIMQFFGVTINLMSLFAFILAIGIVVDDAIVVGENIYAARERGATGLEAAIEGARRITRPVIFAVCTTVAAFIPLLFVPGMMGKIFTAVPIVVISVLVLSLIESLLILPNHLSHLPPPGHKTKNPIIRAIEIVQEKVDVGMKRFTNGPLRRGLKFSTNNPGIIIASSIAMIVLSVALVAGGYIRIAFFPEIEADIVTATLEMPEGTSITETRRIADRIEMGGRAASEKIQKTMAEGDPQLVTAIYTIVGQRVQQSGPHEGGSNALQANVANVQFRLLPGEERTIPADEFANAWRDEVGPIGEAKVLNFKSELMNFGAPVAVEVSHPNPEVLDVISQKVMAEMALFDGIFDIESDQSEGTQEIQLTLKPAARSLGLTLDGLAREVRAGFFGEEALRVQRGREDVRVYVRLPQDERNAVADLESYRVPIANGSEVPLGHVANVSFGSAPATINRKDSKRVVTLSADVNPQIVTGQEVSDALKNEILPRIQQDYPQMLYSFGGEQEEQAESMGALVNGFILALFAIYALLAIPFKSYTQPLIIMSAIPFGIIGAFLGHYLMGISVGILSMFGIIGLSGVVVNDGLVMIDFINELSRKGKPMQEAIIEGAMARFRPILLTSLTTFLGIAPIIFERSLQAQFLIPMAVSLGFGILFATSILMLLVPAMTMQQYRAITWFGKTFRGNKGVSLETSAEPAG